MKTFYIAAIDMPISTQFLDMHHITHLVNLAYDRDYSRFSIMQHNKPYRCDISSFAYDFIEQAFDGNDNANVLVHHSDQTDWSAVVILGYLIKKYQMTLESARSYLNVSCGEMIVISKSFLDQLKDLETFYGAKSTIIPSDLTIVPY